MEKKKNMLLGLMQLVGANGGNLESRIVLQKQAYVLGHEGFSHFPVGSFTYHHFGPFSRELSDCLQFAKSSGLLSEHVEVGANENPAPRSNVKIPALSTNKGIEDL